MLQIKDYNIGVDINDYFIIISFCNPKSQNWKTLKSIIINNFKCFEKDKYFYLLCEDNAKQIEVLSTILHQICTWKTVNIFYKGNLINYHHLSWLECYKNHLLHKTNCDKKIPAVSNSYTITISLSGEINKKNEEIYLNVPCERYPNYYSPFGSDDMRESIKNVNDYFNAYPEKHHLHLCPLFNKQFNFEKENSKQIIKNDNLLESKNNKDKESSSKFWFYLLIILIILYLIGKNN